MEILLDIDDIQDIWSAIYSDFQQILTKGSMLDIVLKDGIY